MQFVYYTEAAKLYPKIRQQREPSDCHPKHFLPPTYDQASDNFFCRKCFTPLGSAYHDRNMRWVGVR